jgi:hypothetical protein
MFEAMAVPATVVDVLVRAGLANGSCRHPLRSCRRLSLQRL